MRNTTYIKEKLLWLYHHSIMGSVMIFIYHSIIKRLIPDKVYIQNQYKKSMGKKLNLNNPKSLNEKINWLKLYDRNPLYTKCADKYLVREYVKDKIGDNYLVPLHFKTEQPNEIIFDNLPDTPCIIKTNHDSGGGFFVNDKTKIDYNSVQKTLENRLKINYYYSSREWQYKNIVPCIIVEKLLMDNLGKIPMDYKLHCINGKVNMIQVDIDRGTEHHHRNWYSVSWNREPYHWSSIKGNGKYTLPSPNEIDKPQNLEKMIELSEKLSAEFAYVRVDWYDVNQNLYFGELTFHHDGGCQPILPEKWDYILGERLNLNLKK